MSARCCPTPSRGSPIAPTARSMIGPAARGSRHSSPTGWGNRSRSKARRWRADANGDSRYATAASSLLRVEAVDMAQCREGARPDQYHQQGSDAADQHRRKGADPGGHDARAEIAELIGGAEEERTHCVDASAHLVGSFESNP